MTYNLQNADIGSDQAVTPPDTQLAVGPDNLLEMVNDSGSVWNKSGGLANKSGFANPFDLNSFFPVPPFGLLCPFGSEAFGPCYVFSDPRVLYDAASGRWFASGMAFDILNYNSQAYVAVSNSSDPTGSWTTYGVQSNTSSILYDQPKIGVSDDKVVMSWNAYQYSGGNFNFVGAETWVLEKSDMLSGASAHGAHFSPDSQRYDLVPIQALSSTSTAYLVYNNSDAANLVQNQNFPSMGIVAVTGLPSQQNITWTEQDLQIVATQLPPGAVQKGSTTLLDTDDDRLLSAVWQNGILWTTANDACVPAGDSASRACLRLIQANTNTNSILQDFDVGMSGGYLSYPAVSVDPSGNAAFAFTASSPSDYPSAAVAYQSAASAAGTIDNWGVVANGTGPYNCTGCSAGTNGRWGDYSAVATDPGNPSYMWATAEYVGDSSDTNDWGTWTAEISVAGVASPTPSVTGTVTPTPTITNTPTDTGTPTSTGTPTITPTVTYTSTATDTPTMTNTPTITNTSTDTATVSNTPTATSTNTGASTTTATATATDTPTLTPRRTPKPKPTHKR